MTLAGQKSRQNLHRRRQCLKIFGKSHWLLFMGSSCIVHKIDNMTFYIYLRIQNTGPITLYLDIVFFSSDFRVWNPDFYSIFFDKLIFITQSLLSSLSKVVFTVINNLLKGRISIIIPKMVQSFNHLALKLW